MGALVLVNLSQLKVSTQAVGKIKFKKFIYVVRFTSFFISKCNREFVIQLSFE